MFVAVLLILTILTVGVFDRNAIIAIILAGLLWMVWFVHSKLNRLSQQVEDLEAKLAERKLTDSNSDSISNTPDSNNTSDTKPDETEPSWSNPGPTSKPAETGSKNRDDSGFQIEFDRDTAALPIATEPDTTRAGQAASMAADSQINASITSRATDTQSTQAQTTETKGSTGQEQAAHNADSADSNTAHSASQNINSREPRKPNLIDKLVLAAWSWLTGGNVFVRAGIIVLFMGMTFLTRYAIGQNLIPIEIRLAIISAVALGLLFWGWKQREKKQSFSLVVQGGGVGLLYLTIFAGFSLYDVIPSSLAFTLLAVLVILAAVLAITQDAKSLALFATIGGFLAPVLTSSGNNNYVGLFSYYTLLNLGIFAVAWFKSWRILNFTGFIFTFLISTVWGVLSYQKEFFTTTEPFLIVFFLLYVAIGILFAHKRTPFYKNYVDSSLIFGTPIFAFGLQCAMVKDYQYGVTISAVVLGAFYLILTSVLWKKYGQRLRLLSETFLSLGVIFTTLAIPFAIDGYLSSAAWAIEGAGILWVSIKQQQRYRRYFGTALVFAAGPMLIYGLQTTQTVSPFINSFFIGCVIVTIAATLASWLLSQDFDGKRNIENTLSNALILFAVTVLLGGFEIEISGFELFEIHGTLLALLCGIAMPIYTLLATKLDWQTGHWVSVCFVLPLAVAAVLCINHQTQLSNYYGYLLWPACLLACFYGFKKSALVVSEQLVLIAHLIAASIIVGLLLWDGLWQLMLGYSILAIVFNHLNKRLEWPQLGLLAMGFFPVLVLCSLLAIQFDGDLVTLSNIASTVRPPFQPGILLWPFSFIVYFYLVHQNRRIGGEKNKFFHYTGALLIGVLLLWLGFAPLLLGASLLAVLFCIVWQKFNWPEMRIISMALLPVMLFTATITFFDRGFHLTELTGFNDSIPSAAIETGFYLWPLAFIVLFWTFWRYDQQAQTAPPILHGASVVLVSFIVTWELAWHLLDHFDLLNAWLMAWLPIVSMAMITIILRAKRWPFSQHSDAYQYYSLPVLVMVPAIWSFVQLLSSGSSSPLPWVPIVNPLDIVQLIILVGALLWRQTLLPDALQKLSRYQIVYAVAGFGFLWANVELLRGVHHWVGIPWQFPGIISANVSQTIISLFWAFCGLVVTVISSKRLDRTLWFFGGALLVAVVLKLFLIDLSAQGTIERIVSFTGVGLLLVTVGYFSPLPPRDRSDESRDERSSTTTSMEQNDV